jgi:hypothetical protein
MRKLEALYLLVIVLLCACAPSVQSSTRTAPRGVQIERRVARHDVVHSAADMVARGYSHAEDVDWTQAPYYVLVNEQGLSCVVPASTYALVSDGDMFACAWRRGAR